MNIRRYWFRLLNNFILHNWRYSSGRSNIFLFRVCLFLSIVKLFIQNWRNFFTLCIFWLLINLRMISLLHPTMAFRAVHSSFTSRVFNRFKLFLKVPVRTFFWFIIWRCKRISPKILYIMCINTIRAIMRHGIRAPNSLIFSQIKFWISC